MSLHDALALSQICKASLLSSKNLLKYPTYTQLKNIQLI